MKRLAIVTSLLLCVSCVHKYAVPDPAGQPVLRSAAVIYLVTPEDGLDARQRDYAGSGEWTRAALEASLVQRGFRVTSGPPNESMESAVAEAFQQDAAFVISPVIEHWADHLTEWSGTPDKITIRIRVLEVPSGSVLDDRRVRASSRWFTLGGDHPQDLLPELTMRWVETVAP